ncbi:MAG: hypothetical protein K5745_00200 [Saccharofermentans sp.]|nr:hypothetical protein [Saccharofermentans sp.]
MNKDLKMLVTGFVVLLISIIFCVATAITFAVQLGTSVMKTNWSQVYTDVSAGIEELADDVPDMEIEET